MINNNFQGGLNWDDNDDIFPNTDYRYAEHLISRDGNQITFKSNESLRKEFVSFEDDIIGVFYIDEVDYYIAFIANGAIYKFDKQGSKTLIVKDSEFGCDWGFNKCEKIEAEFKSFGPCKELITYFTSQSIVYRLNITELSDPVRKQALKDSFTSDCDFKDCTYFHLMDKECLPVLKAEVQNEQVQTQIKAGNYSFVYKVKKRSGFDLNYSTPIKGVNIGSLNNISGERGYGEINISIENLPKDFDILTLVVIKTINGYVTSEIVGEFNYSGDNFSYTYRGDEGQSINFNELLERNLTYINASGLIQKDGRLWLFRVKSRFNPDLQHLVDNIKTKWLAIKINHKDAEKHNIKSVPRGETKAYGIKFNGTHGLSTPVFHISACNNETSSYKKAESNDELAFEGFSYDDITNFRSVIVEAQRDNEIDPQKLIEALECIDCGPTGADVEESINDGFDNVKRGLHDVINKISNTDEEYDASRSIKDYVNDSYKAVSRVIIKRDAIEKKKRTDRRTREEKHVYKTRTVDTTEEVLDYIDDAEIIKEGYTRVKKEKDISYPDIKNCEGNYIYGERACTPVCHHQYPWTDEVPHFIATSDSTVSKDVLDNDFYNQQYMVMLGTKFIDIPLPSEEQLGFELCKKNPYTIVEVTLNDNNKTVLDRGMITNNHISAYQGKKFVYKRPAINSFARISRYIDVDGKRYIGGGEYVDPEFRFHYSFYSNTSLSKRFALTCTHFRPELTLQGNGWKHNLYAKGEEPEDSFYGTRTDQRGTCQSIALNKYFVREDSSFFELTSKTYIDSNTVTAPPVGTGVAFMNKHNESSLWISMNERLLLQGLNEYFDYSFIGGTIDHSSPVFDARAIYGALYRELDNQYGDLHSLSYSPLYQGTSRETEISTFNNDVYISPFSFRRTDFISDKTFDGATTTDSTIYKTICKPSEFNTDITGFFNNRELPEDLDLTNPYNYGSPTSKYKNVIIDDEELIVLTDPLSDAEFFEKRLNRLYSDVYYPGLLKSMIAFTGESLVNPYKPVLGDEQSGEVVYPFLKNINYCSHAPENNKWEESYMNRFYIEHVQPSKWALVKKSLILTTINLLLPAGGLMSLLSVETAVDGASFAITTPIMIVLWFLIKNVFFDEKKLNKMFGIPECKTARNGDKISDENILQFEDNYNIYNPDYIQHNNVEIFYPITNDYYTCKCDETSNEIFYSPMQIEESNIDVYSSFKINNYVVIPGSGGKLQKLYAWNGAFYAHTTDGIYMLSYSDGSTNSLMAILIGNGELMRAPQRLYDGINEGHAGLQSPKALTITPLGVLFVDEKSNKPYLFNSELTPFNVKMSLFFDKYMEWCENYKCETPYTFGFDPLNERIFFTKNDGDKSWTLTYDIYTQRFISFHSYTPDFYFWDRFNCYSVNDHKIYKHDNIDEYYPVVLDTVINSSSSENLYGNFTLNSIVLNTQADISNKLNRHMTFNKMAIWNTRQTTGVINLVVRDDFEKEENLIDKLKNRGNIIDLVREDGQWRVNDFYDYTKDYNEPLTYKEECSIKEEIRNFDYEILSKQNFQNRILEDRYFNIRLIYDDTTHKFYIKDMLIIANDKMR